jgi:acyl carrier protein
LESIIIEILEKVRPECNFLESKDFIYDGLLDSFDMVILLDEIENKFKIRIDGTDVIPNNFSSIKSIVDIVEVYEKRK